MKPIAIIESPYAGDVERNLRYLRACMRDSIMRGEAPFASHALYTQPGVLDDNDPEERALGISLAGPFLARAKIHAFYVDLGMSDGMSRTFQKTTLYDVSIYGLEIHWRRLGGEWSGK